MLDSRHAATVGLLDTARTCAAVCGETNVTCRYHGVYHSHPVTFPDEVKDALAELRSLKLMYPNVDLD